MARPRFSTRPILFDLTRLAIRLSAPTPNGIDRIDYAYAREIFSRSSDAHGLLWRPLGARLVSARFANRLLDAVEKNWGENDVELDADVMARLSEFLAGDADASLGATKPRLRARKARHGTGFLGMLQAFGASESLAAKAAPPGAVYLNVSQFPLWAPWAFRWQRQRPDIAIVTLIHDLLPISHPEYFRFYEGPVHRRRLAFVAERASAAIVSTEGVRTALLAHLRDGGRMTLPVHAEPFPAPASFAGETGSAARLPLGDHPYFVICGTIEPRKNHLLLLQIWRNLATRLGAKAPKLVIVGKRGWENQAVLAMLNRCPALRGSVIEVSGLPTPGLRLLMRHARAMLVPSHCEGYGLPVVEAQASGVPLILSDVPVFREIGGEASIYVDPLDGPGWTEAILKSANAPRRPAQPTRSGSWDDYFRSVGAFVDAVRPI